MSTTGINLNYIIWGFESRLKQSMVLKLYTRDYIIWGFESRLKPLRLHNENYSNYIIWGFESRLKHEFAVAC